MAAWNICSPRFCNQTHCFLSRPVVSSLSNGKVFPSGEGRYVPASSFISRSDSTRMRFGGIPSFLRFAEFVQKSVEPVQLAATATKDETVPGGDKAERRGKKRNAYRASCNRVGCAALPQRCFFFCRAFCWGDVYARLVASLVFCFRFQRRGVAHLPGWWPCSLVFCFRFQR